MGVYSATCEFKVVGAFVTQFAALNEIAIMLVFTCSVSKCLILMYTL